MTTAKNVAFAFIGLCLCSCQTSAQRQSVKSVETIEGTGLPTLPDCGDGNDPFIFQPVAGREISPADIGLTGAIDLRGQREENDSFYGFQLVFCLDGETGDVQFVEMDARLPQTSPFSTRYLKLVPDSTAPSAIWEASLANGGHEDLEVVFRNFEDPTRSYLLKGWKIDDGYEFVTISTFDWDSGNRYAVSRELVKYGALVEGNPWVSRYHPHDRLIETDNLRIELRYRLRRGQNNYKTYRVSQVRVADSNPRLASPFEGVIEEADDSENFEIVYTHHSLMDQFIAKFAHATYVIGLGVTVNYEASTGIEEPWVTDVECGEVSTCGVPFNDPPRQAPLPTSGKSGL